MAAALLSLHGSPEGAPSAVGTGPAARPVTCDILPDVRLLCNRVPSQRQGQDPKMLIPQNPTTALLPLEFSQHERQFSRTVCKFRVETTIYLFSYSSNSLLSPYRHDAYKPMCHGWTRNLLRNETQVKKRKHTSFPPDDVLSEISTQFAVSTSR